MAPQPPRGLPQSLAARTAEGLLDLHIQKPGDVMVMPLPGEAAFTSLEKWVWGEPHAAAQGLLQPLSRSAKPGTWMGT